MIITLDNAFKKLWKQLEVLAIMIGFTDWDFLNKQEHEFQA